MTEIYVQLLDEGVEVYRPVESTRISEHLFELSAAPAPEGEQWEFDPGAVVVCKAAELSEGPVLLAFRQLPGKGEFEQRVALWLATPFPEGGTSDITIELKADLVNADTSVAESIVPYLNRDAYRPALVDVVGELQKLRDRSIGAMQSSDAGERILLEQYVEYAELLIRVYGDFLGRGGSDSARFEK